MTRADLAMQELVRRSDELRATLAGQVRSAGHDMRATVRALSWGLALWRGIRARRARRKASS